MTNKVNRWNSAKIYRFGRYRVAVLRCRPDEPRRFYTELRHKDEYVASFGSNAPFYWTAAVQAYLKREVQL